MVHRNTNEMSVFEGCGVWRQYRRAAGVLRGGQAGQQHAVLRLLQPIQTSK